MKTLSILELGQPIGYSEVTILNHTREFAVLADQLGYKRFWLGEHHDSGSSWRNPDVLICLLATITKQIRVGSGGILLPLNSPLRVAQNYKLLATLFPNRIDLGLAKGISNNQYETTELLNGVSVKDTLILHNQRVKKVIQYLESEICKIDSNTFIINNPLGGNTPTIWVLGSTENSMNLAIEEKSAYSFSLFHDNKRTIEEKNQSFLNFIDTFYKVNNELPITSLAVTVICGETKKDVDKILCSINKRDFEITLTGNKDYCIEKINHFFEIFKTNEILIHFVSHTKENKIYCYESFSDLLKQD